MKKNGLVILPFAALLILAVSQSLATTVASMPWLPYVGYVLAAACLGGWFYGDREFFKHFFSRKGFRYGASSGLLVVMVITALVGFAYLTSRDTFNKKWDVTKNQVSSLAPASVEVAEKLKDKDIEVQAQGFFSNPEELANFKRLVGLYVLEGAPITVDYVDPGQNPEQVIAAEIKAENTVIFEVGERTSRITTFTEEDITNVLLNLMKEGSKKVYFTKGHGEGGLSSQERSGFAMVGDFLGDQKIQAQEVSLIEAGALPEDADLVVIAGAQYDFQPGEITLLEDYLKAGGSLLVAVGAVVDLPQLHALTEKYGVLIEDDALFLDPRDIRARMYGQQFAFVTDFDDMHGITKKFSSSSRAGVQMLWPATRSISLLKDKEGEEKKADSGYSTQMIIKTAPNVVRVAGIKSPKDLENVGQDRLSMGGPYGVMAVSVLDAVEPAGTAETDEGVDQEEESKLGDEPVRGGTLAVLGSAAVMSNLGIRMAPVHAEFAGSLVSYLVRDDNFVSIAVKKFDSGHLDLSSNKSQYLRRFLLWIYPALFFGVSLLYWLLRRRKTA